MVAWRMTQFGLVSIMLFGTATLARAEESAYRSHPPMRPLPAASTRPLADGPRRFVDRARGDDAGDGSEARPWKTLAHAVKQLRPGDTLYLRGGTYFEHVTVTAAGQPGQPITIRAFPGELAILDGGLPEFQETPAEAWEPCPAGGEGEFQSRKTYPDLGGDAVHTNVLGRFADSMIPLHGYRFASDLRSRNVYWTLKSNVGEDEKGIWCGPGVWFDVKTGRIHVRLAHTNMKYLGDDNYRGETDPRQLPLVIAGHKGGPPLTLRQARWLRVQDLVVRGARTAAVEVGNCADIELDGLTVYGGATALAVRDTAGFRLLHTACRGIAAPWTFRGSLKYRALEARIFSASGWTPTGADNRDFELAWSEFTDSVDGVFIGNVAKVRFHHNLLDNVSDDGVFLTAGTAFDGTTPGGDVDVFQNLFARCLTTFAFGVGHGRQKALPAGMQTGAGVRICRNVFDYRRPVHYHQPTGPDVPQEVRSKGRFASDHGSPAWEPMDIYHNTIIADDPASYAYGTAGLGDHIAKGTRRRVFNNIIVQLEGLPGSWFPPVPSDFQVDGNLHWSLARGPGFAGDPFAKFRQSKAFAESKASYPPGWGSGDRFADPKFARIAGDWKTPLDLQVQPGSPALDAGVALPADWPDPLRSADKGRPDVGAIPAGVAPWRVGVQGRLTVLGENAAPTPVTHPVPMVFPARPARPEAAGKPAVIIQGYPARDAELLEFALRRHGVPLTSLERTWLPAREYSRYGLVAIVGNLVRAQVNPTKYAPEELEPVRRFLEDGGTLLLMLTGKDVFASPEGQKLLVQLVGTALPAKEPKLELREPRHPWVNHLDLALPHPWLARARVPGEHLLRAGKGERIIAAPEGHSILYRQRVGKGQLIYVGWELVDSLPSTRSKASSVDQERVFEEQAQVLFRIVADAYPTSGPAKKE